MSDGMFDAAEGNYPQSGEFTTKARERIDKGEFISWISVSWAVEACDLIDRLTAEKESWFQTAQKKNRQLDRLTAENKAQAEAHQKEIMALNDKCVEARRTQAKRIERMENNARKALEYTGHPFKSVKMACDPVFALCAFIIGDEQALKEKE